MVPNEQLAGVFASAMADMDVPMEFDPGTTEVKPGATDQGNVAFVVPSIHPNYDIGAPLGATNHTEGFTAAAGTPFAFKRTLVVGQGLAKTAWAMLTDDELALTQGVGSRGTGSISGKCIHQVRVDGHGNTDATQAKDEETDLRDHPVDVKLQRPSVDEEAGRYKQATWYDQRKSIFRFHLATAGHILHQSIRGESERQIADDVPNAEAQV
ncbi:hypothetical protein UA08_08537 [Talaromyces atroroseus]|uniref:Uncharacterized protein n=1 Tax=Talaromyces atroroseus TaxID=1441469 RepID=A0A1Q5Q809_TALAT|nr:hypothetical protein UA08_08537 [Talaromyces atroroseus]OKL56347.1 hypothetical protein UA08_08537 [Talaromyces atroroseus]